MKTRWLLVCFLFLSYCATTPPPWIPFSSNINNFAMICTNVLEFYEYTNIVVEENKIQTEWLCKMQKNRAGGTRTKVVIQYTEQAFQIQVFQEKDISRNGSLHSMHAIWIPDGRNKKLEEEIGKYIQNRM
ncbi:MAG TPA: hypothetical protein PKM32_06930 [Planctomycetota bacterium]|nr:hypothetical protein [Planctomycetota bacterium]HPY75322.1 hypothetical protein [Planctomycetota bacterium]HQB00902.1 hypothetical protein [Planctomycetota bacterium]